MPEHDPADTAHDPRLGNGRPGEATPARRVTDHPVLGPLPDRPRVAFTFDGATHEGFEGEPVAAALLAHGIRTLRASPSGRPRAAYCFIGHCFECRVIIDGVRQARACLEPVRAGMDVTRSDG
jgi:sarcosine oxidase subunit alpha